MIGHYLLTLTPEQEDRLLTMHFHPILFSSRRALGLRSVACCHGIGCNCLCGRAGRSSAGFFNSYWGANLQESYRGGHEHGLFTNQACTGFLYERMCVRFGLERMNFAIRQRILTNKLWRAKTVDEAYKAIQALKNFDISRLFQQGSPV